VQIEPEQRKIKRNGVASLGPKPPFKNPPTTIQ